MNVDVLTNGGVNVEGALEFLGNMETYNSTLQDFLDENKTWWSLFLIKYQNNEEDWNALKELL